MVQNKFLTILISITSYSTHKYVLWAKKGCSNILYYHPRFLLHSWPHIVTLWTTIATHLWEKMAEKSWKQVFVDTYLHNLFFHTQICWLGQQVVFKCPILSPKVPITLMTQNEYSMGHHSHLFVSEPFLAIFAHKWVAIVAHRVTIWGHECSRHLRWYHRIVEHHFLTQRTDLCEEKEVMQVSIDKNLF